MSDPTDNDDDLDLEFDEVFSDLGQETRAAEQRETPAPDTEAPPVAAPASPPPSRGLYRPSAPPPPEERVTAVPMTPLPPPFERVTVPTPSSALPPAPAPAGAAEEPPFDPMTSWDDDEPNEATRVVALPAEMLAALGRRAQTERPTAPPPSDSDVEHHVAIPAAPLPPSRAASPPAFDSEVEHGADGDDPSTDDHEDDDDDDDDEPVLEFEPLSPNDDGGPDALSELLGDLLADAPAVSPTSAGADGSAGDALWDAPPPYESAGGHPSPPTGSDNLDVTPDHGFDAWRDDDPPTSARDDDEEPELDFGPSDTAPPPASPSPPAPGAEDAFSVGARGGEDTEPPPVTAPAADAGAADDDDDEPELAFDAPSQGEQADAGDDVGGDDDEPELAFDAASHGGKADAGDDDDDDDEPELEFDAPSHGASADAGDDDDDEPDLEFDAPAPAASAPRPDAGAEAARRTVRGRKKRPESFPLVGRGADALAARRTLLESLAHAAIGPQKAQLLTSAAELAQQLGQAEDALQLLAQAHDADPHDAVALRGLRQESLRRGDLDGAIGRLEAETRLPLAADDKALTLSLLAELQLMEGRDADAEKSARAGLALAPRSLPLALLAAEAAAARGDSARERDALSKAADASQDAGVRSALYVEAALRHERSGAVPIAANLFRRALDAAEDSVTARLGAARTALGLGAPDALQHVQAMEARLEADPVSNAAVRRFRALLVSKRDTGAALTMLGDAPFRAGRELAAHLAVAAGDQERAVSTARAWAESTSGTDRAEAYLALAEAAALLGDEAGTTAALESAAVADPEFAATRVLRETLARRSGGAEAMTRVAAAEAESSAIVAAARLAAVDAIDDEATLLRNARESAEAPLSSDVIGFDVAAEREDYEGMAEALKRQVERTQGARQLSPLLTLASIHVGRGDPQSAVAVLQQAHELTPGNPLVTRPLSRMMAAGSPEEAGALLLQEASAARGPAAAAPYRAAADWLAQTPDAAADALYRALDADPQSAPAVWALDALGRRHAGDPQYPAAAWRRRAAEALLDLADDPLLRAEAALRLANERAAAEPDVNQEGPGGQAGQDTRAAETLEYLCRALDECPHDATLVDLVASAEPGAAKQRLDQLADAVAARAPALARLQRLRAAWLHARTGDHAEAAARYRLVLGAHPGDPLARAGIDRLELRAGEHARVGERRFAALREAEAENDANARVEALTALAELDLHGPSDVAAAALTLRGLLSARPGHIPTLRALERLYMDQGRRADVADVSSQMLRALSSPEDVATYLPFASRLQVREADDGAAGDALYLAHARQSAKSPRVARRWLAVAEARQEREQAAEALRTLAELTDAPLEKATHCLRAAGHRSAEAGAQGAAAELGREEAVLTHPVAAAVLGHYRAMAGYALPAAEAFVEAAKLATDETYAAAFWYEAGCLFQDKHEDERALSAFERTAAVDITHRSVFVRMRELLEARSAHDRLAALISQRLARGGDTETVAGLHVAQAALAEQMNDNVAAREALRAALALHPDSRDSLERLARICLADELWTEAEGALIRWARLERGEANLRFIFFSLGDIYDRHIRQDARAEAAFQRVIKLAPADMVTLDRLASLYQRLGKVNEAVAALQRMVEVEQNIHQKRDLRLRIGTTLEKMGHAREAEQAFEQVRRSAPTDLVVVRALASFFERQDARPALAMHLNRAVGDYRRAIEIDPANPANWVALVDVMVMRGRRDGARCAASAALALGITEPQAGQAVDTRGGVPGAGHAAADPAMKDFLAKDDLSHAALVVFEKAEEALEKVLPLDLKSLQLDKVLPREHHVRQEASEAGRWFGFSDVHPRVTHTLPRVCVPISLNPLTLVVGAELLETTDARERTFLFARACEIAKAGLSVALRSPPAQLAMALAGLVHAYDTNYVPEGVDPAQLADIGQRVVKALPRRVRDEMGPLAVEMAGRPGFDPRTIGLAAGDLGNRVALLATGDLVAALSALLKLNGYALEGDTRRRAELLRAVPETASLLRFAVAEEYLDARHRAGADSL